MAPAGAVVSITAMPGDADLERTLDAIEADLDAVERALSQLDDDDADLDVDLDALGGDIQPGRLADHLARREGTPGG
jgi:hypothetical protein